MSLAAGRLRPALLVLVLGLAVVPAGCVLDLGGDDDPIACKSDPDLAGAPAATLLVNPETLACEDVGFGCGGCGACDKPPVAPPTWGECQSVCTGLGVAECAGSAGCRQTWDELCLLTDGPCPLPDGGYLGCFAVDTTGPVQGACEGLDATGCSRHDDCLATYRRDDRCSNGLDEDDDTIIDEPDECRSFGTCLAELRLE